MCEVAVPVQSAVSVRAQKCRWWNRSMVGGGCLRVVGTSLGVSDGVASASDKMLSMVI